MSFGAPLLSLDRQGSLDRRDHILYNCVGCKGRIVNGEEYFQCSNEHKIHRVGCKALRGTKCSECGGNINTANPLLADEEDEHISLAVLEARKIKALFSINKNLGKISQRIDCTNNILIMLNTAFLISSVLYFYFKIDADE